jgi:ankyrin repeat protein
MSWRNRNLSTPGDYALCAIYGTTTADSNHACDALTAKFDMTEVLEDQNFNSLHRIVLGISGRDLAAEADEHPELINKVDAQGRSALYWATWRSDVDRVKVLLEAGADGTLRDMEGQTALHLTANTGSAEIARLLLQSDTCGALTCLNLQNNSGYCPWHIAVVHGCEAVLAELLQHACDFRLRTNLGRSILHLAMRFGSLSAAQHLLKAAPLGASAEPDHSGKTAADYLDEFHEGHPSVLSRDSETVEALGALLDAAVGL